MTNQPGPTGDDSSNAHSASTGQSVGLLSNGAVRVLLAVCLAELVVIVVLVMGGNMVEKSLRLPLPHTSREGSNQVYFRGHPGPWGQLEFIRIMVEPPDEFVTVDDRGFDQTRWYFENRSPEALKALFNTCDLTPAQRTGLLDSTKWLVESNAISLIPGEQLILDLSSSARAEIYSQLAESPRNDFQCWPYTFRSDGFEAWFRGSELSPGTLDLLRRLSYTRGASLCFSDLPEVFARIPSLGERRQLIKTLSRTSTLLVKLQVGPKSDINALTDYWSHGGRAKDVKPLLESLTQIPGGVAIDVAHLLPPFARKCVYTYPNPDARPVADCYWTAFNFFRDPADNRYIDPAVWQQELRKDYEPVQVPTFGDIMLLLNGSNVPIHAVVYVADDIVFTKNGGSERRPWLLMEWADMLARYPQNDMIQVMMFRRKQ